VEKPYSKIKETVSDGFLWQANQLPRTENPSKTVPGLRYAAISPGESHGVKEIFALIVIGFRPFAVLATAI
jgi:hypothetical protein